MSTHLDMHVLDPAYLVPPVVELKDGTEPESAEQDTTHGPVRSFTTPTGHYGFWWWEKVGGGWQIVNRNLGPGAGYYRFPWLPPFAGNPLGLPAMPVELHPIPDPPV